MFGFGLIYFFSDYDYYCLVFMFVGWFGMLYMVVLVGVWVTFECVDFMHHVGVHLCVGVFDVVLIVYLIEADRGKVIVEAFVFVDELGEFGIFVYLYGELVGGCTCVELCWFGVFDDLMLDFGLFVLYFIVGVTLVIVWLLLIAFNVEIDALVEKVCEIVVVIRGLVVKVFGLEFVMVGVV